MKTTLDTIFHPAKWTLKTKLMVVFSSLCILGMMILLLTSSYSYFTKMTNQIYETEQNTLQNSSLLINTNLEQYSKLSKQIFANSKIRSVLKTTLEENTAEQNMEDIDDVKNTFRDMIYNLSISDISSIIIHGKNGRLLNSYDLIGNIQTYENEFYNKIVSTDAPFVLFPTAKYKSLRFKTTNTFALGRLIRDDNLNEMGYLLIFISDRFFKTTLSKSNLNPDSSYYIVSDDNKIMYSQESETLTLEKNKLLEQALSTDSTRLITSFDHQQVLISKHTSEEFGLTMISAANLNNITQTVQSSIFKMILVFILIVLAILITAWFIAKDFTHPLEEMQTVMSDISSGNLSLRVKNYQTPDMNHLALHFNTMISKIEQLVEENEKKQKELIQTELQMLHAQINPHFLYNTISSISWLAVFNGQTQIKDYLSSLTALLRRAYSDPEQLVTLSNEKELLTCYTDIMKLRYDNFTLIFDLPESTENYLIPKYTLQPIVENSIIHGFPNVTHPCVIQISIQAKLDIGQLSITISDNGTGMTASQLIQCKEKTTNDASFSNIGIHNVDQRIKLKFGTQYGLSISSRENEGTKVTIQLPLLTDESRSTYD